MKRKLVPQLLDRLEALIAARLKRSLPRRYRQLMESGELSQHLIEQVQRILEIMGPSINEGVDESAALEFVWPLIYPEKETRMCCNFEDCLLVP